MFDFGCATWILLGNFSMLNPQRENWWREQIISNGAKMEVNCAKKMREIEFLINTNAQLNIDWNFFEEGGIR